MATLRGNSNVYGNIYGETNKEKGQINTNTKGTPIEQIEEQIAKIIADITLLNMTKADKTEIPDVSHFITKYVDNLINYYNKLEINTMLSNKANISDIPDVSQFITRSVDNLINYYDKLEINNFLSEKADYGFTGVISGTTSNPTNAVTLANGNYISNPAAVNSYINIPLSDGTTKRQSVQRGGIVIRTAGRLLIFATQCLMYQYDSTNQYFYEAESFIESILRREPTNEMIDLGTIAPPNTYYITDPIYYLEGVVNTGETGHTKITFTVSDSVTSEEPFELMVTDYGGNDLLYNDGAYPNPKYGETWVFDINGNKCNAICYKETEYKSKEQLLEEFIEEKAPILQTQVATGNSTTRNVDITQSNKSILGSHSIAYYNLVNFIPIDLSIYSTNTRSNMLQPYSQLPDGYYQVIAGGKVNLGSDTYSCIEGELIYKKLEEFVIIGMYGAVYYAWNSTTQEYTGGFFTTETDATDIAEATVDKRIKSSVISSGSFIVANKENGIYFFDYTSATGNTRRITINVEGTSTYYFPWNVTMLIKSDKNVIMIGRENLLFEYDSTNSYYKQPIVFSELVSKNDLYYSSGDTENINAIHCSGLVTSSTTKLGFTLNTPKLLNNISTVSITSGTITVRGISGYVENSYSVPIDFTTTTMTKTVTKSNNNAITIELDKGSAFNNVTNNTPVNVTTNNLVLSFS